MFAKSKKKATVQFCIRPPDGAVQVYLAGGFREWRPLAMKKQKDGRFTLEVPLPAGRHEYKFLVDGRWMTDPDNSRWVRNAYGTFNSLAEVE
jgi:1,4-alpha-glucan branching enzyme